MDDASTDETDAVVRRYGSRVRMLRSEENIERGAARNWGAREAHGDVVAFLDSDDEWLPGKLREQLPRVRAGVACVASAELIDENDEPVGCRPVPQNVELHNLLGGAIACYPSSLVVLREEFLAMDGFPEALPLQGSEDWAFFAKWLGAGRMLSGIPEPQIRYRVHPGNWTMDASRVEVSMWAAVRWLDAEKCLGEHPNAVKSARAMHIARRFANAGDWDRMARWIAVARRFGIRRDALRELRAIPSSVARGAMRRRVR